MSEKQTNNKFLYPFLFLPAISMYFIGKLLFPNGILGAGILMATGGIIGFWTHQLIASKKNLIKTLVLILILVLCFTPLLWIKTTQQKNTSNTSNLLTQNIGDLIFNTPKKLSFRRDEFTDSTSFSFDKRIFYTTRDTTQKIIYFKGLHSNDSIAIDSILYYSLEALCKHYQLNIEQVSLIYLTKTTQNISANINVNGDLLGYVYFKTYPKWIESLWLLPISKTFTQDFISQFKTSIHTKQ